LSTLGTLKSQYALAVRYHGVDSPQARETRDQLKAEKTAVFIRRLLNEAPPLSDEVRAKLAELLKPARDAITAARLAELDDANGAA
jgi:hypothetical protein